MCKNVSVNMFMIASTDLNENGFKIHTAAPNIGEVENQFIESSPQLIVQLLLQNFKAL